MNNPEKKGFTIKIVEKFLTTNFSLILIVASLIAGAAAVYVTPREEEPQIVVPMADVIVSFPGASAREVEQLVSTRLEKLLWQIDGVEYVYSMSKRGMSIVTVRFYVGEDREDSLVKLYNKINQNIDIVPPGVTGWVVKPIEVDDVPILTLAFSGAGYDRYSLRRIAEEVVDRIQAVENTSRTMITGGSSRAMTVYLEPAKLASRNLSILDVGNAIRSADSADSAGSFQQNNSEVSLRSGTFFSNRSELENMVVGVFSGSPVYLRDVAGIFDGEDEYNDYTWIGFGKSFEGNGGEIRNGDTLPSVTISVAKKKGTNAVWVAKDVLEKIESQKGSVIPDGVNVTVTRNYGDTANEKVNDLLEALLVALITVIALIWFVLGWKESLIVALAIPITYSLTLMVNYLLGYTINRVTLFALILALGLLVDDPIVDVENIYRHFKMKLLPPEESVLAAVNEVRPPIIIATLAVIVSFVPLFFITGMMGPYMRPMAFNVPVSMIVSIIVAFTVTPWASLKLLRKMYGQEEEAFDLHNTRLYRIYSKTITPFLESRRKSWLLVIFVFLLVIVSALMPLIGLVPMKMLPFDNKDELQLVIDMPEGTTLEDTDRVVKEFEQYLFTVPEINNFQSYAGTSSPMDFNGMARHYYLRNAPNVGDIRIIFKHKKERKQQSHEIALRMRNELEKIAKRNRACLKIVEVPPGPPVISTIVAEIYGEPHKTYEELTAYAKEIEEVFGGEPGVSDIDSTVEDKQTEYVFRIDRRKASLNGVRQDDIVATLKTAVEGEHAGTVHIEGERNPVNINLRLPRGKRSGIDSLRSIHVKGNSGGMIPVSELGSFVEDEADKTIYHKNLSPVAYVFGETTGVSPVNAVLSLGGKINDKVPEGMRIVWNGEGEWKITLDVFRDLGIAFAAALAGIYILLVIQTYSLAMPLIIMVSIPFTLIGIMPGFSLLNLILNVPVGGYDVPVFFTATAMIGMIALSGIVVRNSIILIDFIHSAVKEGKELETALIESGAVRFRPILLTAGTALLGNWVITLDPIFSGLAWSIIFGVFASTLFTLLLIPVVYNLIYGKKDK